MPRISHEQKQLYKAKIRSVISRDHQASQKEVQLRLETDGLKLDRFYLAGGPAFETVLNFRVAGGAAFASAAASRRF
jgi:hypothetical protein